MWQRKWIAMDRDKLLFHLSQNSPWFSIGLFERHTYWPVSVSRRCFLDTKRKQPSFFELGCFGFEFIDRRKLDKHALVSEVTESSDRHGDSVR